MVYGNIKAYKVVIMENFMDKYVNIIELLRIAGKVKGRKKLQEMVYILKSLGAEFTENFYFHYYGPYSDVLTVELEELKSLKVVNETVVKDENDKYICVYELNNDFGYKGNLSDYKEIIDILNAKDTRFLELVAAVMYFRYEKGYNDNDIIRKVRTTKSDKDYTDKEINDAFKLIGDL